MSYILGIDPGLDGAIAVIDSDGILCLLRDIPVQEIGVKGKNKDGSPKSRRVYDNRGLSNLFKALKQQSIGSTGMHAFLERVHAMPEQGISSAFSFGRGYGNLEQALVDHGIAITETEPQRWKKAMLGDMGKNKGNSLYRARQLFPDAELNLKKHHNRAEALLMAEYGRRILFNIAPKENTNV